MNRAVITSVAIASSVLLTGVIAAQTSVNPNICKLFPRAEVKTLLGATDAFDGVEPSAWAGKDGYGCSYSGLSIVVHDGGAVTPPANADLVPGLGKVAFVVSGPMSVELRSDLSGGGLRPPYNQIWITRTLDAAGAAAARSAVIAIARTLVQKMKVAAFGLPAVSVVGPSAQVEPGGLSGRWTLTQTTSNAPTGASPFGPALNISHSGSSVTLAGQAPSVTYLADGRDHDLTSSVSPSITPFELMSGATSGVGTYRAAWSTRQLIVVRRDAVSLGTAPHTVHMRRVIRQAFTLTSDGSLIADSLMITDPLEIKFFNVPETPAQDPPANIRSVYKKAQ